MADNSKVTPLELARVETAVEQERTERRHEFRRVEDRMTHLEASHVRLQRIVVGENGANGLASDVRSIKNGDKRWERLLWFALCTAVGLVAYFIR